MKNFLSLSILLGLTITGGVYFLNETTTNTDFDKELSESTFIYDRNGVFLDAVHGEEHRVIASLSNIDQDIQDAVVAIEDRHFYQHNGVSSTGVLRAIKEVIKESVANKEITITQGASTIPMQLAKNLNGDVQNRTFNNKVRETIQAMRMDSNYSKEVILEKYLNLIFWGNNSYGVEAATNTYFGKSADNVEVHEAAMLAALIQNPNRFNPYSGDVAYQRLKTRQKDVLNVMALTRSGCEKDNQTCRKEWVEQMFSKPLLLSGKATWQKSKLPFVSEAAIKETMERLRLSQEDIETKGYRIITTVDINTQLKALKAINKHSGRVGNAQMALVAINHSTNKIEATVGSKNWSVSPLNRSLVSYRQPGSAIKPFVYYQGFSRGLELDDILVDEPYCIKAENRWSKDYCPRNYGGSFAGEDTLINHLKKSRNIPAVILGQKVGIRNVIRDMERLGFTTKLESYPSFPLGSNDVKPVEMANAYGAFANGGYVSPYTIINKVYTTDNEILINETKPRRKKVLSRKGVNRIDTALREVVLSGTGYATNVPGLNLKGKTGTTDSQADVWFVGYDDELSTAVWIGNDNYHNKLPYGATGGGWAAPVFRDFYANK